MDSTSACFLVLAYLPSVSWKVRGRLMEGSGKVHGRCSLVLAYVSENMAMSRLTSTTLAIITYAYMSGSPKGTEVKRCGSRSVNMAQSGSASSGRSSASSAVWPPRSTRDDAWPSSPSREPRSVGETPSGGGSATSVGWAAAVWAARAR